MTSSVFGRDASVLSPHGVTSFPRVGAWTISSPGSEPLLGVSSRRQGGKYENRCHRRHRPDWLEDRRHFATARPRGVIAASSNSGVNTITGEGLKQALVGAQVVIDLANSRSFEDKAVMEFFETSERHLLPAELSAGVRHHVALSIVAIDRTDNGYFRAKVAQEN